MTRKILWIDNNPGQLLDIIENIQDEGFRVELTNSASRGADKVSSAPEDYFLVIIDILMYGDNFVVQGPGGRELLETPLGTTAGLALGRWIKRRYPAINVIGMSMKTDPYDTEVLWYRDKGDGYFDKYTIARSPKLLINRIKSLSSTLPIHSNLKTYIIHSHDDSAKDDLQKYIRNTLRITNTIILRQGSLSNGSALAKIDLNAPDFHVAFALLTSHDLPDNSAMGKILHREGWQYVFFEMGFFYCLCLQGNAKLFFLHKKPTELHRNIPGLHSIDITEGFDTGDQLIRQHLADYLPLLRKRGPTEI